MIHTTQKNYMQDIPEDFISEMTEAFKLFDNVNKSIILLELINWWIKGDANVWIQRKDGKSVIVSLIQRHTVSQLWISQIANQTTTTTNIARIANNKWKWQIFEEKNYLLRKVLASFAPKRFLSCWGPLGTTPLSLRYFTLSFLLQNYQIRHIISWVQVNCRSGCEPHWESVNL